MGKKLPAEGGSWTGVCTIKIICFGDSNTYGYDPRSYLGGRYPADGRWLDILRDKTGWEIENRGENGREVPRSPLPFPIDTDLLIIMLGTNDLLQGRSPQAVAGDMEHFIRNLNIASDRIFLIASPPMALGQWVQSPALIQASVSLAKSYKELSVRLGIRFADAGQWGVELAYDGVHFTRQGHRSFAAGILRELHI